MPIAVEDTLLHGLHRASQVLEAELGERLAGLGLTPRQATMLMAIGEAGEAMQTTLVAATGVDRSTIGTIFERLEKRKLIRRPRSKVDTRARLVSLTDEGRRVEREARTIVDESEQVARVRIGKDGAALGRALKALATAPVAG